MRTSIFSLAAAVAVVLPPLTADLALAVGYWNMPGTFYQCVGYGVGPGYHAPMVLGPISCEGLLAHDVRRLPHPPALTGEWPYQAYPSSAQTAPLPALFTPSALQSAGWTPAVTGRVSSPPVLR